MTTVTVRTGPDRLAGDWACRECRSVGEVPAVHRRSVAPRWAAGITGSRWGRGVSGPGWPPGDWWRDVNGVPITRGAWVEQQGRVLRRSARMLVVRFEGDTVLTRIRPHLVRVVER